MRCCTVAFAMAVIFGTVAGGRAAAPPEKEGGDDTERTLEKALGIYRKVLGEDHPQTATSYANLASFRRGQDEHEKALPLHRKALEIRRKVLGETHPETAKSTQHVAATLWNLRRHAEAVRLWQASWPAHETVRFHLASTGFDRALGTSREQSPHAALSVGLARLGQRRNAFRHAELNLARGLLDDLASPTNEDAALVRALRSRLGTLDAALVSFASRSDLDAEQRARRDEAVREHRAVTSRLARLVSTASARQVLPLERIQESIPADAALVLWIDSSEMGEHWVCVVRGKGAPVWRRLPGSGKKGEWTKDDTALAGQLHRALSDPASDAAHRRKLLDAFRKQRFDPIKPDLKGVYRLFVVPTGAMSLVPADVLTDVCVAYVPSGSVLARLREKPRAIKAPTILAVGDPAGDKRQPGTRVEAEAVAAMGKGSTLLLGSEASEQKLDALIDAGKLKKIRLLHLATRGEPDEQRPGRSALILARDKLPDPLAQVNAGKHPYDGRLTVSRIRERWVLDADLVVLSGDETGLGRSAGGDGLLGFTQAYLSKGARGLILSRWKVDRPATSLLMIRFYENLLVGRKGKPLSRIAALHEAKNWLRTLPRKEAERLATLHAAGVLRSSEGDEKLPPKAEAVVLKGEKPYEHPHYWAAFTLMGDPD